MEISRSWKRFEDDKMFCKKISLQAYKSKLRFALFIWFRMASCRIYVALPLRDKRFKMSKSSPRDILSLWNEYKHWALRTKCYLPIHKMYLLAVAKSAVFVFSISLTTAQECRFLSLTQTIYYWTTSLNSRIFFLLL